MYTPLISGRKRRTRKMFIDVAMSWRLESVEEAGCVGFSRTMGRLRPELGCAVEAIAGGSAAFAGIGSPLSHALSLGLQGPVSKEDVDRLEDFYYCRRSYVEVVVSPYADPTLMSELGRRNYRLTEWNNVYFRPVARELTPPDPRLEIRAVRPGEERMWAELVGRCFGTDPNNLDRLVDLFSVTAEVPHAFALLTTWEGRPAGGAGGIFVPEHGVAGLYGAGILPEFRNRGIQTALLQHRLRMAADAGCEYAVVVTMPGTASERNVVRTGFRLAYTKAAFQRPLPA